MTPHDLQEDARGPEQCRVPANDELTEGKAPS
jgi:hypothetical protein